jgi:hypothetical protein
MAIWDGENRYQGVICGLTIAKSVPLNKEISSKFRLSGHVIQKNNASACFIPPFQTDNFHFFAVSISLESVKIPTPDIRNDLLEQKVAEKGDHRIKLVLSELKSHLG